MDLRSYLRGLGVGIAVTTIVLMVSFSAANHEPSAEEIIQRAKELGMVESTAFMPSTKESSEKQTERDTEETLAQGHTEESTQESVSAEETTETSAESQTQEPSEPSTEAPTEPVTEAPTPAPTRATVETMAPVITEDQVIIELRNFTQAYVVAQMLQDVGVLDDSTAFTAYMVANNYETRVFEGTYTFTKGLSYEEIARIICRIDS